MDRSTKRSRPPPPLNRKYIRALHDHEPSQPSSECRRPASKTVTLRQGDVVLVHLTNSNGWADGTVLNSGDRGWIPANYCEPYDHEFVRIFFHGLTELWTAGARDNQTAAWRSTRREEVQVLVTGVRHVLDKTRCLRREDNLIKTSTTLQTTRRSLLAELSALVKHSNYVAEQAHKEINNHEWSRLIDDYTRRCFKVAVRLVRFMDVWEQYVGDPDTEITINLDDDRPPSQSSSRLLMERAPDVRPLRSNSTASHKQRFSSLARLGLRRQSKQSFIELPAESASRHSTSSSLHSVAQARAADKSKRRSAAPAYRAVPRSSTSLEELRKSSRVSELLTITQAQFFDNVGSFLGLHMQSSPADEIKLMVLRTLGSSSTLLALIKDIRARHMRHPNDFDMSIQAFSNSLAILAGAIQPDPRRDSKQAGMGLETTLSTNVLMSVATTCIRTAADCVTEARRSLRDHGDYTLDAKALLLSAKSQRNITATRPAMSSHLSRFTARQKLTLQMQHDASATTPEGSPHLSPRPGTDSETSSLRRKVSFSEDVSTTKPTKSHRPPHPTKSAMKASPASISSDMDSWRSSTISAMSCASTRATTPDLLSPLPASASDRASFLDTSISWLEAKSGSMNEFASQIFAHELVIAADGQLLGGSPRSLVEYLIHQTSDVKPQPTKAFFLSFRQFMSAADLAGALISQYKILDKKVESCFAQQERVLELIKIWLGEYWDTQLNVPAMEKFYQFATNPQVHMLPSSRHQLLDIIGKVQTRAALDRLPLPSVTSRDKIKDMGKTGPPSEISKNQLSILMRSPSSDVDLIDFTPLELARQLTLMASRTFNFIEPPDLLPAALNKSSPSVSHIRAMSTLSTNITHLVSTSIVSIWRAKSRALLIKHWIKVASACLGLRNYDTLMAIMCALNSSAVTRLHQTWSLVPTKNLETLEELKEICEFTRNFSTLRRHIKEAELPCLPFIGLFLTDLTFVDAGNPSTRTLPGIKSEGKPVEVVNFDKYVRTTSIVETVERFQSPYELRIIDGLRDWLIDEMNRARNLVEGKKEGMGWVWDRSCEIEPKEEQRMQERDRSTSRDPGREKRDRRSNVLRKEKSERGFGFVKKMSRLELRSR
ncbi:RasGEF domain-containing protein 4 [Elsinoe fawcettii]|nr:RasGEF domain-containing protein 4 [Elsinoe fawcettii]